MTNKGQSLYYRFLSKWGVRIVRVRLDEIKEEGITLEFSEEYTDFPMLVGMVEAGEVGFPLPLQIRLRIFRVEEMVEVEGELEISIGLSCSRCLKGFELPVSSRFSLTFTRELPGVEGEDGEEGVEVSAEDMGLILFEGEEIDLRDGIQEQVIMALPFRPLCRPQCKGLCPSCGADRNVTSCGCESTDVNLKFAALKDFKVKKK